jgi:hypothetical protein
MELATDFSPNMVLEMQSNAALKARRIVIRRMLGGKTTFKHSKNASNFTSSLLSQQ